MAKETKEINEIKDKTPEASGQDRSNAEGVTSQTAAPKAGEQTAEGYETGAYEAGTDEAEDYEAGADEAEGYEAGAYEAGTDEAEDYETGAYEAGTDEAEGYKAGAYEAGEDETGEAYGTKGYSASKRKAGDRRRSGRRQRTGRMADNTDKREAARRIRQLEVKINRQRLLIVVLLLAVLLFAGLFAYEVFRDRTRGQAMDTSEILAEDMRLAGPEGLTELFTESYVRYLKMAYVLFGTYPDCSYYKVVAGVARDDYDFENDFYIGAGDTYMNYYRDGVKKSRVAIDVSTYQKNVDWEQVKASGVDVAIVRTGFRGYGEEGKLVEDSEFKANLEGALQAGLDCGVYFFTEAVSYEEGVEEAEFVLEQTKPYRLSEPIVVDTEKIITDDDVRANNLDINTRTEALLGFLETIEKAGYTPMIYASTAWYCQAMDLSRLGKYEWWLAAYDTPQFPYHVEGWQYSSEGSVPGIEGNVDMNVWLR